MCSFLSYHDTMSYTDHLFGFSNQSQCQQIMHDVEFSGATFVKHFHHMSTQKSQHTMKC
ncbi:unnamed protein product [Schistosoma mattheei]|uniref:Uncharacterized protein n=1 Tax=Schistosoma mattheei TaxID=31246 RepID=A0A3P8GBY8_9TREM|nr:unnamed protein product [Schistosoma mattheei]